MLRRGAVVLALVACGSDSRPRGEEATTPPPPSDNPIDVAIWPRLVAAKLTDLPPAPNDELCRRIALDLIGVTPSDDERQTLCVGKDAQAIARGFMATPRFRAVERRFWIRRLGADPTAMMADHIKDADRIFESIADGIAYDDFVARLLAHPIATINRTVAAGDDVAPTIDHIFRTFLGRTPSAAERADYANLLRPWRRRHEDRYDLGYGYYTYPAALDPDACKDPVLGSAACTSTLLGAPTTINPPIAPMRPSGYSQTSDALFYYEVVQASMPAAVQAELEKPGRLLATRADLWNEAADFALARLLGWWRSTLNQPESVLPEVREALATWFRTHPTRDLRELYVVIMSSLLYTTAADGDGERPPWATGPTKLLEPEQLLDSVARALDRDLGACDPHTDEKLGLNFFWPHRLRDVQAAGAFDYREAAQQLGGCLGAIQPPRHPGLPALLQHIELAREVCASPAVPSDADVAPYLFARFVARAPTDDEQVALAAAATACSGDASCDLAREVCGALLRSTVFLYY